MLPLDYGLSLQEAAQIIGVSVGWTSHLHNALIRGQAGLEKNSEEIHKCRQAKARGMPITLMFQDKARLGRINNVRWAPKPIRPRCQAMLPYEYTYAYAAVDVQRGVLDTLALPARRHPDE